MTAWRQPLLALVAGAVFGLPAHAAVPEAWTRCEKEIARYCPKAEDEDAVFRCIAKRVSLDRTKLSEACYAAYEDFELRKCGVSGCDEDLFRRRPD
jgi:hypothetical protein